jgi:type III secretory pathway component EscU
LHHLKLLSFGHLFNFGLLTLIDEKIFIFVAIFFQFSSGTLQRRLWLVFGVVSLLFESINILHFLVYYFLRLRIDLGHESIYVVFLLMMLLLDLHLFFEGALVLDEEIKHLRKLSGVMFSLDEVIRPHKESNLFPHLLIKRRIFLEYL